jgi:hypothetical protein
VADGAIEVGSALALVVLALYVRQRVLGLRWGTRESLDLVLGVGWIDALQLLLVFVLVGRITERVLPAITVGLVLAVTPPLVCESRNLRRNAIASLLVTLALLAVLRGVAPSAGSMQSLFGDASLVWGLLGVLLLGLLFFVDRSTALAFVLSAVALVVLQGDFRVVGLALLGVLLGVLIAAARSAQLKERVTRLLTHGRANSLVWQDVGPRGQSWLAQGARLVGENPFVLLVFLTPVAQTSSALWLYWWTVAAVGWAFLVTFVRPLQLLGPGVLFMRLSVFPSAYVLAMNVNDYLGAGNQDGLPMLCALIACVGGIAYVYRGAPPTAIDAVIRSLERSHRRPTLVLLVGGLLVTLALAQVEHAIGAVLQRDELMYGEAIIYDHAARLVRGEPLYQALGQAPYTVAAYTPVYYWITAGMQSVFAGFGPGRVVSLLAGLVAAALVADLARRRARSAWAGLFAAALFLALGFPTQGPGLEYPWFSYYKEDMLGVTFALGAIALLDRGASPRRVVVAAVLSGLAVLTKQTLVAAGVAGFVWLALRELRLAALFAAVGGALVLGVGAAMALSDPAFLSNVLAVAGRSDPLNDFVLEGNLQTLFQFQAVPLAITAVYLVARLRDWRKALEDIMVPYALASLVPLVGLAKIGSNYNYWIDLAAITAVVTTQMIWGGLDWTGLRLGPTSLARVEAVVPTLLLLLLGAHLLVFVRDAQPSMDVVGILPSEQQRSGRHEAEFQWLVDRVRTEPKLVLSESLDLVVLARRPVLAEPIIFTMLVNDDQWTDAPLARRICAGDVGLLVLRGPLEGGSEYDRYMRSALWPPDVLEALRETMALETTKARMLVYSPSDSTAGRVGAPSSHAVCPVG